MIDVTELLDRMRNEYGVPVQIEHTGGGNYSASFGEPFEYDEEQGLTTGRLTIGPIYAEGQAFVANRHDLYFVSRSPNRADEVIHTARQMLPLALSMLGIEDVNVDDACMDLDEIAAALGDGWSVGCLGGNIYGVVRADGHMITLNSGWQTVFLPGHLVIGRQSDDDPEWFEVWSGDVWEPADVVDIVNDRVTP